MAPTTHITRMECALPGCRKTSPTLECKECGMVKWCSETCKRTDVNHKICMNLRRLAQKWHPSNDCSGDNSGLIKLKDLVESTNGLPSLDRCAKWATRLPDDGPYSDTPAYDILKLKEHEGLDFDRHIRVLLLDGDMGILIKTIAELPSNCKASFDFGIDNGDTRRGVCAVIVLIIALNQTHFVTAAEAIIHIMYSALMPNWVFDYLEETVQPILKGCKAEVDESSESSIRIKIGRSQHSHKGWIVIPKRLLLVLREIKFRKRTYRDVDMAMKERQEVFESYAPPREIDQHCFNCPSEWRASKQLWQQYGVILPHQASWDTSPPSWSPNPMCFDNEGTYTASTFHPSEGWSLEEIRKVGHGTGNAPSHDLNGLFFFFMRNMVVKFIKAVYDTDMELGFTIYSCKSHEEVEAAYGSEVWDRIDASYAIDICIDGLFVHEGAFYRRLLQDKNPHATLITHFRGYVTNLQNEGLQATNEELQLLDKLSPVPDLRESNLKDPRTNSLYQRRASLFPSVVSPGRLEKLFSSFARNDDVYNSGRQNGLLNRETNSIVPQWPISEYTDYENRVMRWATACHRIVEWRVGPSTKENELAALMNRIQETMTLLETSMRDDETRILEKMAEQREGLAAMGEEIRKETATQQAAMDAGLAAIEEKINETDGLIEAFKLLTSSHGRQP